MNDKPERVLVVGPRRGLLAALDSLGLPYVLWSESERAFPRAEHVHVAPVFVSREAVHREVRTLAAHGPFTHVIAGGENSVVTASRARRELDARRSLHTTVQRCRDKLHMKRHLSERGIPMTPFLSGAEDLDAAAVGRRLGFPFVVKPRTLSGGRGIEVVEGPGAPARFGGRRFLLERWVDAPEVSVESFVNRGEILFESVTEYAEKGHVNVVPAGLDEATRAGLLDLNRRIIEALSIDWGMTHAEYYLTPDGLLFGEIALRPPGGYIMDLLRLAHGFDPWKAFVSVELDRPYDFSVAEAAHAAAVILHPGAGTVRAIRGVDDVRGHDATVRIRLKVAEGERITQRAGAGNDVGFVLLRAPTREALLEALGFVDRRLKIEMTP